MTKDIEREAFEALPLAKLALSQDWVRYHKESNTYYPNEDFCPESAPETINFAWQSWQAAKAHEAKKLEGGLVVPHGVLDLTRFMCKTWSEIDKFVYKNCSDIGQYPVIQGTQNQLNLSRIGEQQINANEINKGVKWLLEAARGGNE